VPTCSSQLMRALGELAKEFDAPIQSHLSENIPEVAWVSKLHPDQTSYAGVYDAHGLLTARTIMAHCVHLKDEELRLLAERRTSVAHCPNSNFSLTSGVLNVRKVQSFGIVVGLGTDVSGGYSPSMLDAMRQAIIASKVTHFADSSRAPLDYQEAFYLATRGGAAALGLDKSVGWFRNGLDFDALLVDCKGVCQNPPFDIYEGDSVEDMVSKFVFLGDDRNISEVYVAGKRIK